jgi:hypothetical protein
MDKITRCPICRTDFEEEVEKEDENPYQQQLQQLRPSRSFYGGVDFDEGYFEEGEGSGPYGDDEEPYSGEEEEERPSFEHLSPRTFDHEDEVAAERFVRFNFEHEGAVNLSTMTGGEAWAEVVNCLADVARSWPNPRTFFLCYAATPYELHTHGGAVEVGLDLLQLEELLRDVLASVGKHGVAEHVLKAAAQAMDEDRDGLITYEDFLHAAALDFDYY